MSTKINPDSEISRLLELDQPAGRRKGSRKWQVVVLAAVVLAVILVWKMMGHAEQVQYKTQEATRGDLTVIVTATGTLQPTNEVEVGSELSGIVKSVEVDFNDKVTVGQPLAHLDTTKISAQVMQSRAALESARAKVLEAKATLMQTQAKLDQMKKVRELSDNKVPSQTEYDAAEADYERAKADLASANASVFQAQATLSANLTDLSKTIIRSPVNGVVLGRNVEPGQTVAASFQVAVLFTLAEDLTQMELHVDVDEADIGKVHEGQEAEFNVAAYPNRNFKAVITEAHFGSSTTSGVVTYETVLKVDNSDLALRPGMTATADITVQKVENALLVPSAALRFSPPVQAVKKKRSGSLVSSILPHPPMSQTGNHANGDSKQQHVWVLNNGKLTAVTVTVGSTDGSRTEITSGEIEPGAAVVTDIISQEK
ncbi:efflux RND transporter periplasmic adaptor subunit [bacterium]|nr:efflux RND transporter periplasmic adaptor subunit [bacterium]